jgi:hypothetical protein
MQMEEFLTAQFWLAVGQIIMIDILLGGDNAVVIALACRKLPEAQRKLGIIWGTVATHDSLPEDHRGIAADLDRREAAGSGGRRRARQHPIQRQALGCRQDGDRG